MSPEAWIAIMGAIQFLLALAFAAGMYVTTVKRSKKDVNGLGTKVNRELARSQARHQNVTMALMLLANSKEEKDRLAELLKESTEDAAT